MTEVTKETVVTQVAGQGISTKPVVREAATIQTVEYVIYFLFGVLESLLAFRFIFKLAGASVASGFVRWIYNLTGIFTMPFEGIFQKGVFQGTQVSSVFEPATLLAIAVYALVGFGLVKLIIILSGEKQELE